MGGDPDHLHHRAGDGHGSHGDVAAIALEGGVERDIQQRLRGLHHEGGHPQRKHRGHEAPAGPQGILSEAQGRLLPREEPHHPDAGNSLGDHGGQGRALHAHIQTVDENGVQDDVADSTNQYGAHTDRGKALGGDKQVHPQSHHYKQGPAGVDAHVGQGVDDGLLAAPEDPEQLLAEQPEQTRQSHGDGHQAGKAAAHDLLRPAVVPLAHGDGRSGRAALGYQHGESADKVHHREAQPDARQGQSPHLGHMADVNAVHNIVQQVHQLGHHRGSGQLQQQLPHRGGAQLLGHALIGLVVHSLLLSMGETPNGRKYSTLRSVCHPYFCSFSNFPQKPSPCAGGGNVVSLRKY